MRPHPIVLLACIVTLLALSPAAASAQETPGEALLNSLNSLESKLKGSLSPTARATIHGDKFKLIATHYTDSAHGVSFADVITNLDCVATNLQRAKSNKRGAKVAVKKAKRCHAALTRKVKAGGKASAAMRNGLKGVGTALKRVEARIKEGRAFGVLATAARKAAVSFVRRHFSMPGIAGVRIGAAYADFECIDVKVEAGKVSGAGACARHLIRQVRAQLPPSQGGTSDEPSGPPVTFGSDLTGDPVAMPGTYPEDTEFWTQGLTVPVTGELKTIRVRVGSNPRTLPIRFSRVRPQPDGRVMVITTTDPPYEMPGGKPGTYEFPVRSTGFNRFAQKGDIVTIDNSGADQTPDPYVWFARKPGFTTFSYTNPPDQAGAPSQDPGFVWTPRTHEGYDLLMQVVVSPN